MRGRRTQQASMLCLVSPESVVPADHPLRAVKRLVEVVLQELSPIFDAMYAKTGRPSIPPERLLKATLLMALHTVRSERLFCEQLGYNLLFKWFLDMDMHEPAFDPTSFGKNRGRLLQHDVGRPLLPRRGRASPQGRPHELRALLGRRNADRGVGLAEELPPEG
jgi:transposase